MSSLQVWLSARSLPTRGWSSCCVARMLMRPAKRACRNVERRVAATCVGAVRCTFFRQLGLWTQCARPEPPRATRAARVGLKHPMVPSPCPGRPNARRDPDVIGLCDVRAQRRDRCRREPRAGARRRRAGIRRCRAAAAGLGPSEARPFVYVFWTVFTAQKGSYVVPSHDVETIAARAP